MVKTISGEKHTNPWVEHFEWVKDVEPMHMNHRRTDAIICPKIHVNAKTVVYQTVDAVGFLVGEGYVGKISESYVEVPKFLLCQWSQSANVAFVIFCARTLLCFLKAKVLCWSRFFLGSNPHPDLPNYTYMYQSRLTTYNKKYKVDLHTTAFIDNVVVETFSHILYEGSTLLSIFDFLVSVETVVEAGRVAKFVSGEEPTSPRRLMSNHCSRIDHVVRRLLLLLRRGCRLRRHFFFSIRFPLVYWHQLISLGFFYLLKLINLVQNSLASQQ